MHTEDGDRLVQAGDRLPALSLPAAAGGGRQELRAPARGAPALLFLPRETGRFRSYLSSYSAATEELRQWYGRPLVILADPGADGDLAGHGVPAGPAVLIDSGDALRRSLGLSPQSAALVIADRWGELYDVTSSADAEGLPGVDEVEEWLKFLATQCPECGVIDEPGHGEWALI